MLKTFDTKVLHSHAYVNKYLQHTSCDSLYKYKLDFNIKKIVLYNKLELN